MTSAPTTPDFATIHAGDALPPLSHGALTTVHLMRWSAAIENWHRIHYDAPFAIDHDGLPGPLINGSWKQHFVIQMLRQWAGPSAWVRSVSFQFRAMDVAGSTLTAWGTVVGTSVRDGLGYAEVEVGIRDESGRESTPGHAVVVFPVDRAVPYPFPSEFAS